MSNLDVDRFLEARAAAVGLEDLAELGVAKPGPATPPTPEEELRAWIEDDSGLSVMSLRFTVRHPSTCWERCDLPNVALFHYDDLLADLPGQMCRLARELDIDLPEERIATLADAATFEAMKNRAADVAPNTDINIWRNNASFFNRGTSGQWRDVFSDDDLRAYERRMSELATPDLAEWLHTGWLRTPT